MEDQKCMNLYFFISNSNTRFKNKLIVVKVWWQSCVIPLYTTPNNFVIRTSKTKKQEEKPGEMQAGYCIL